MEVVIVGGGAIGCAVARELAGHGAEVTVIEKGEPGGGATRAAGGMLSPLGEAGEPGPFLRLALRSFEIYPDFVAGLEEETGIDLGHRHCGKLMLAFDSREEERLRTRLSWIREEGHIAEWLAPADLRLQEPDASPDARGGLLIPGDRQVDNRRLGPALWAGARTRGSRFLLDAEVQEILVRNGRVVGVGLDGGEEITADRVVVAGGAWSGRLGGLPRPLPVEPVRGQMVAIEAEPGRLRRILEGSGGYLIPRPHGPIIAGSTEERVGFEGRPTPRGVASILDSVLPLSPVLGDKPLGETWAGLRPGTPDDLPVLGPDPEVEGLHYATGHFRNGILLTPITARLVRQELTGEDPARDLHPFRPDRFPLPSE